MKGVTLLYDFEPQSHRISTISFYCIFTPISYCSIDPPGRVVVGQELTIVLFHVMTFTFVRNYSASRLYCDDSSYEKVQIFYIKLYV